MPYRSDHPRLGDVDFGSQISFGANLNRKVQEQTPTSQKERDAPLSAALIAHLLRRQTAFGGRLDSLSEGPTDASLHPASGSNPSAPPPCPKGGWRREC